MKYTYVIDGTRINSRESFYDEISRISIPGSCWGRNLDAFDDILRGGFGTPHDGFVLKWAYAEIAKNNLGKDFDLLVEIISDHGPGGSQSQDGVELILE